MREIDIMKRSKPSSIHGSFTTHWYLKNLLGLCKNCVKYYRQHGDLNEWNRKKIWFFQGLCEGYPRGSCFPLMFPHTVFLVSGKTTKDHVVRRTYLSGPALITACYALLLQVRAGSIDPPANQCHSYGKPEQTGYWGTKNYTPFPV